ncbi:MAG: hypothetical protein KKE17_02815 [Proteobacteria bacterium]|nr:hypothetical protein [Pseudomonadota bacterium]MBU1708914.1 hypothetical protein [Pseudomonadota bacterium]
MTDEETGFIPYEMAMRIVGNVIEEEHIHETGRRILTVYDKQGNELCWYDAEEIMADVQGKTADERKTNAVEMILHQIPEWAVDDLLAKIELEKA